MAKCSKKIKNPCKLCLQPVTQKTGLQCQGACLSWVHYSCLNYTPGRVADIKRGIIKVTCPCPDCKTKFPKEYRTDEPFSCSNQKCPANHPQKCTNSECPTNSDQEIQKLPPLTECGTNCKKHDVIKSRNPSPGPSSYNSNNASSGDVGRGGDISLQAVEQMCNTVGQLASQLNDLMSRMKQRPGSGGQRVGGGSRTKNCCCPGNPGK